MDWDYNIVFSEVCVNKWWNSKSLDYQLDILKKYYPIGAEMQYCIHAATSSPVKTKTDMSAKITEYVLTKGRDSSTGEEYKWYNLLVKNCEKATIRRGRGHEELHIIFFYPSPSFIRDIKLNKLGL